MLVKIGVSFSAREARELVSEINAVLNTPEALRMGLPLLAKLQQRLQSPLTPDKIPAVVENNNGN